MAAAGHIPKLGSEAEFRSIPHAEKSGRLLTMKIGTATDSSTRRYGDPSVTICTPLLNFGIDGKHLLPRVSILNLLFQGASLTSVAYTGQLQTPLGQQGTPLDYVSSIAGALLMQMPTHTNQFYEWQSGQRRLDGLVRSGRSFRDGICKRRQLYCV